MKVERRETGHVRQPRQVERVVEVIGQPHEHPLEPLGVIAPGRRPFVHRLMLERWL
jgi:hypothetical protein